MLLAHSPTSFVRLAAMLVTAAIAITAGISSPVLAQEFQKDAVNSMFDKDTKVQMYEPKDARKPQRERSNTELAAERQKQHVAFLEAMCRNLGPKSSACTDLEELKTETPAADSNGETWE
jgi:hypothetical protein